MNQTDLYSRIENILQEYGKVGKDERAHIILLVREYYAKGRRLTTEGPCLQCGANIQYKVSATHLSHGEKILAGLFRRWAKKDPVITPGTTKQWKVNGYTESTVTGYLCESCQEQLKEKISEAEEKYALIEEQERRKVRNNAHAIIRGETKATASKRYYTLVDYVTPEDVETLKQMPYSDFLKTFYWEIIRKYKLYRAAYKCELCSATNEQLNVHHRTYENHGEEHCHLDDLIVLCRPCHAKFHDKLAEPQTT